MARPSLEDAIRRRDAFAALIAADLQACRRPDVVEHARAARLDVSRALRLSWDPGFLASVTRMANARQAA